MQIFYVGWSTRRSCKPRSSFEFSWQISVAQGYALSRYHISGFKHCTFLCKACACGIKEEKSPAEISPKGLKWSSAHSRKQKPSLPPPRARTAAEIGFLPSCYSEPLTLGVTLNCGGAGRKSNEENEDHESNGFHLKAGAEKSPCPTLQQCCLHNHPLLQECYGSVYLH